MGLDNDRLSHWFIGALLTWILISLLMGFPIFHFWLGFATTKVMVFMASCFFAQLAITPWLFSARSTPQNPSGNIARRTWVVILWVSTTGFLLFSFLHRLNILSLATITLAIVSSIVVFAFKPRQRLNRGVNLTRG